MSQEQPQNVENKDYFYMEVALVKNLKRQGITNYGEIILYGKILSMSNTSGYCTATNGYFSDILQTEERNIKKYIKKLKEENFIKVFYSYDMKNGRTQYRKIYPQTTLYGVRTAGGVQMDTGGVSKKVNEGVQIGKKGCPNRSSRVSNQVREGVQMTTQVIDSNRVVIDSSMDADAGKVADAPERCVAAACYADAPLKIRELKFEGNIPDASMFDVMQREYENLKNDKEENYSSDEIKEYMIQEFTSGFYKCKEEPVTVYVEYLVNKIIR